VLIPGVIAQKAAWRPAGEVDPCNDSFKVRRVAREESVQRMNQLNVELEMRLRDMDA
jgi:hypothetical protein